MDEIKGYILESGISVPYDYYIGGSHLQRGEKQPNVSACRDKAKVYKTENLLKTQQIELINTQQIIIFK